VKPSSTRLNFGGHRNEIGDSESAVSSAEIIRVIGEGKSLRLRRTKSNQNKVDTRNEDVNDWQKKRFLSEKKRERWREEDQGVGKKHRGVLARVHERQHTSAVSRERKGRKGKTKGLHEEEIVRKRPERNIEEQGGGGGGVRGSELDGAEKGLAISSSGNQKENEVLESNVLGNTRSGGSQGGRESELEETHEGQPCEEWV